MLSLILNKLFGTKQEREVKRLKPLVEMINQRCDEYDSFSDSQIKEKTQELKNRIVGGETENDILPEAFGLVKQACKRMVGRSWTIDGRMQEWKMIPYDVQLMGAIVLAEGKIAEMATGEGKTLVALFPAYLNSLSGKGVHIVTVNDYLAKRDHDWMGYVLEYLGLSVGVVTSELRDHAQRKAEYAKDVVYGVNHEFGFDYLRDNMVIDVDDMVQRGFNYCLIDEVDSILIDEARVPLVISGAVPKSNNQRFDNLKPLVFDLVKEQSKMINEWLTQAETAIEKNTDDKQALLYLLKAQKASPKNKKLMKLLNLPSVKTNVTKLENDYLRDKIFDQVTADLYYTIEERSNLVDIFKKGHELLTKNDSDKNMFVIPDLPTELQKIESSDNTDAEKEALKENLHAAYAEKSDKIHTINQLLRAYSLFEKDVDYVVQDGRVIIVDQSTGRLKYDSRFSNGMHQAIEAKEGVRVGEDTQTVASITYQNYFRMYRKLSGMTGTAITEENEFFEIYNLVVTVIPTNVPVIRDDQQDYIYMTKKEKYNAVISDVLKLRDEGRPVLLGTPDVDVSQIMHKLLEMRKVPHNLLNAKNHAKEAQIIKDAGESGTITIATNMAGRGTDIKLGKGVKEKGGLAIIGCERHDSRRIDRQLRGRAGRQGDPGSSRFYVSLEDNLMRIFGSERISGIMDKFGRNEGEPIAHPWITKSIERAQKRVEMHNFAMRKHIIQYDDVMNKKRDVIYKRRRAALIKGAISEGKQVSFAREYGIEPDEGMIREVNEVLEDFLREIVNTACAGEKSPDNWNWDYLNSILSKTMLITYTPDRSKLNEPENLFDDLMKLASEKIESKRKHIGDKMMDILSKIAIVKLIDVNWQEHLREDDDLKSGLSLMVHAQKDPLVEYKRRSFEAFKEMLYKINQEIIEFIFKARIDVVVNSEEENKRKENERLARLQTANEQNKPKIIRNTQEKVGRNDLCPCGSGLKYKNCHGIE
ncbi:MAG TPA: preprotein translocase subunit SecA [Clostridiales bacterium]|nr:preprotein translocase subunit SecA [Clostridiales bacterium]HQP69237.1 preprotein translocase subunit SecA [Clostridiales bacterium]